MRIRKKEKYKISLALFTCLLNKDYVITNCTYIIKNTIQKVTVPDHKINSNPFKIPLTVVGYIVQAPFTLRLYPKSHSQ